MIKASKEKKWKELLRELEDDVWGKAYRIAMKRFRRNNKPILSTQEQIEIAKELFPEDVAIIENENHAEEVEITEFTVEEMQKKE